MADVINPFATKIEASQEDTDANTESETTVTVESDDENTEKGSDELTRIRAALAKANKEAEASRKALQRIEDAKKSEAQREKDRADAAEQAAAAATARLLRFEIAAETGLTPSLASRLQGSTREELLADAKELKKLFASGGQQSDPDQGRGDKKDTTPGGMSAWMRGAVR